MQTKKEGVGLILKEENITTGVDDLLELLRSTNKIPLADAAKKLSLPVELIQSWVDFLVEEEIIGIEYKFTKAVIYLNKSPEINKANIKKESFLGVSAYKNDFIKHAKEKNLPEDKIMFFWENHVKESLNRKRDFFMREAKKRNLQNIEVLWNNYLKKLLAE